MKKNCGNNVLRATPAPPGRRKIVLTRLSHIRAELGRLYGEARNGKIAVGDASRLANLLAILAKIIESGDLESRLAELEKLVAEGGPR